MVPKSNVRTLTLDLQGEPTQNATFPALRPGRGRYHSLLGLLSNAKLRTLQFSNLSLLGIRTSNLPSGHSPSLLQSFRFYGQVKDEDRTRLANIISHCPHLVDLRLICQGERMKLNWVFRHAIFSLKKLQRLHVAGWEDAEDAAHA
ncbi:hypothetical protein BGW39_004627, partial [Mortierella sp. 14UC]